jgi:hypothetical protein
MAMPMHDPSNRDIARLLLKIGVELLGVWSEFSGIGRDFSAAQAVILGKDIEPWPYFVLRSDHPPRQLVSVFASTPDEHQYIQSCGFDVFLHEIEEHGVVLFQYGHFLAAASTTSRSTQWASVFSDWKTSFVGCPIEFSRLSG